MNVSDRSNVQGATLAQHTSRTGTTAPPGAASNTTAATDPSAAGKADHVSLSEEAQESNLQPQTQELPPDQKVGGVKGAHETDLAANSAPQSPAQKWNAAAAGPDQSRELYNKESGASATTPSNDVQKAAASNAVASTPKPGQVAPTKTVGAATPGSSTDMSNNKPAQGVSRSEHIEQLKKNFTIPAA